MLKKLKWLSLFLFSKWRNRNNTNLKFRDELIKLATGLGCRVVFTIHPDINGYFYRNLGEVNSYSNPVITVNRKLKNIPNDPLTETLILAHEFGHLISWLRGLVNTEYEVALNSILLQREMANADIKFRSLVLEEEERAWLLGQSALEDLGFKDWGAFDALKQYTLGKWSALLGIKN